MRHNSTEEQHKDENESDSDIEILASITNKNRANNTSIDVPKKRYNFRKRKRQYDATEADVHTKRRKISKYVNEAMNEATNSIKSTRHKRKCKSTTSTNQIQHKKGKNNKKSKNKQRTNTDDNRSKPKKKKRRYAKCANDDNITFDITDLKYPVNFRYKIVDRKLKHSSQNRVNRQRLPNKGNYVCADCKRRFEKATQLSNHRRTHNEYVCLIPECGKVMNLKSAFQDHMDRHFNYYRHKCRRCNQYFYRSTLIGHKRKCKG